MPAPSAFRLLLSLVLVGSVAPASQAAPTPWAELLEQDPRLAAEVRWLETGADRSLYLYQLNEAAKQRGIVLLLHDLQAHADWPQVIAPLRKSLPEHGWSTWSLQLPAPSADGDADTYLQGVGARLGAALSSAAEQSDSPVLLLGTGTGASAALHYLSQNADSPARGLIVVSLRPLPGQKMEDVGALLEQATVPVLEVFAEQDLPAVLQGVADRQSLAARLRPSDPGAESEPARYRQMLIEGADARYNGQTDVLTKRIGGWIRLHTDR